VSAPKRRALSTLECLDAGIFASPAAALWLAADGARRPQLVRLLASVSAAALIVAAATLLYWPVRWEVITVGWALYCVIGSALVALWVRARTDEATTHGPPSGWGARSMRAVAIAVMVMPPLIVFSRLLGAASLGGLLARINADAQDPRAFIGSLFAGMLWGITVGWLFGIAAIRRGRLGDAGDLGRATLAWLFLLISYEIVVVGSLATLRTHTIATADGSTWYQLQPLLVRIAFIAMSWRLASWLAWGESRWWRRTLGTTSVLLLGLINVGLLLGFVPSVQLALGRYLERTSRPEQALPWYERSLVSRTSPHVEAYLQHRIALLHYKLGREEQALNGFRRSQTSGTENHLLSRQSTHYVSRLSSQSTGDRKVLAGVEVATERRRDYCAPNTLSLVFGFWGRELSPGTIGEEIALTAGGTALSAIQHFAEKWQLEHRLVPFATVDDIEWLIDRELPALIYIPGHVLAVFGYDERLGTVVTYDTATWDIWVDQPISDLLQDWGQRFFLMGVVFPVELDRPLRAEIHERFPEERSLAAWHWWLGNEGRDMAQRRTAVTEWPAFFPAVFGLLPTPDRSWLLANVDGDAMVELAWRVIEREHAPSAQIAHGLADWYTLTGDDRAILDLHDRLETLGRSGIPGRAGLAAARLRDWETAALLLQDSDSEHDPQGSMARLRAEYHLGHHERAAELTREVSIGGDHAIELIELAEELQGERGPGFLEITYEDALSYLHPSVEQALRLAELSLEAIEVEGTRRSERLHVARKMATIASALAADDEQRSRAATLLTEAAAASE